MTALDQLRALARYKTHGGYVWAAVMADGELVCEKCASARDNYRKMFRSTKYRLNDGWQVTGLTHSGEWEEFEYCSHCNRVLHEGETE